MADHEIVFEDTTKDEVVLDPTAVARPTRHRGNAAGRVAPADGRGSAFRSPEAMPAWKPEPGVEFASLPVHGAGPPNQAVASTGDSLEIEARATADRVAGQNGPSQTHSNVGGVGAAHRRETGPGQPLDTVTRQRFDSRLGFDFSGVRVYTGAESAASTTRLGALAYSVDSDIVFGRNQFAPGEPRGDWLLAHELAHVIQHSQGRGLHTVHRQPEAVPELDSKFKDAVEAHDYPLAAEVLNAFSLDDIRDRINNRRPSPAPHLSRGLIGAIHQGALDNPKVGKDSNVASVTRPAYLDLNFDNSAKKGDWGAAAEFLNAFMKEDIETRLKKLPLQQLEALNQAALTSPNLGPDSQVTLLSENALRVARRKALDARVAAMQASGELTLPKSNIGDKPGETAFLDVGVHGAGGNTGVAMADREPLAPETDWSNDGQYIDNNILHVSYNILTNLFEVEYTDHSFIHPDYDTLKRLVPAAAPTWTESTTPAPAAAVTATAPSPPPPSRAPDAAAAGPGGPKPVRRGAPADRPALGTKGLFFKNRQDGKIYPVAFSRTTIPNIAAMTAEVAAQEPEARARTLDTLIQVASAAHAAAKSAISVAKQGPPRTTSTGKPRLLSMGNPRKSGAQWFLRDANPADVAASQSGHQVYEYYTAEGECLYVGKAGGAGGQNPTNWVDRGWDHIHDRPAIAEADRIVVRASLTEQEAFALEQDRIAQLKPRLNQIPGEFDTRSKGGAVDYAANVQSASGRPRYEFHTDIVPPLK